MGCQSDIAFYKVISGIFFTKRLKIQTNEQTPRLAACKTCLMLVILLRLIIIASGPLRDLQKQVTHINIVRIHYMYASNYAICKPLQAIQYPYIYISLFKYIYISIRLEDLQHLNL